MKLFVAIAFLVGIVAANHNDDVNDYAKDVCHNSMVDLCDGKVDKGSLKCNALMDGFKNVESDLQSYVNSQLATSIDYLLLASHFNSYQKNRPGIQKLFNGLSDKAWDRAVDLIKHITNRGGVANFNQLNKVPSLITNDERQLEVDELHALALALDSEKKLSLEAHHLHRRASRLDRHEHYDPEIAQYLEEKFIEDQADTIRKISGYANDLSKLLEGKNDPSLEIYMFDQHLAK